MLIQIPFWANSTGGWKSWLNILFGGGRFIKVWPWSKDLAGDFSGQLNAFTRLVIYLSVSLFILLTLSGQITQGIMILVFGVILISGIVFYYRSTFKPPPKGDITTEHGFKTGVKDAVNNPYGNPMPYEPGIAVRSSKPPMQYYQDDFLSHMYRGTDELDQNLFFNQIPDPTLVARPVFWSEDPRPDIVSNEAACGDRFCR